LLSIKVSKLRQLRVSSRRRWGRMSLKSFPPASLPSWFIDGTKPSQVAWLLKERILHPSYWQGMLKGPEWMGNPTGGLRRP
jgi:hypothetical protein